MKVVIYANTDWYLYNFRRSFALALRDAGHELLLISPGGPYGERLRALGLRWEPISMDRLSLSPWRELAVIWRLWRTLRAEQPDIVHSFTLKCAVYGSLAARLLGVRGRVAAVAGMGYLFTSDTLKARLLRPAVGALLRLALGGPGSRLILQNPDDVALFEREGLIDSARIRLIPGSGVDLSRFKPRPDGKRHGPARVLLAARLLWDKGVAEYIDAARKLRRDKRTTVFLLAGDPDVGNPAAVPEAQVREWVDEGVVEWLGHVDDMPALFNSVDIVVLPSYYREGLPKSLIESAACALPIVTTDMPGCREVVTHDVDGLLVAIRDADSLANAIARLLDDPALAERLGAAARTKALEQFDERTVIEKTFSVYRELADC